MNYLNFIWEIIKTVAPAIIAWWLAKRSSDKNYKSNRKEMREQLGIAKSNNMEVQNRAFKLQFCLQELEKKELLYEKIISDINVTSESIERFTNNQGKLFDINVAAREANGQLHEVMHHTGTLQLIIKAANPNSEEAFIECLKDLIDKGHLVEAQMNWLSNTKLKVSEIKINYDKQKLSDFFNSLVNMRNFILEHIDIVFKKMNYVVKEYEK